MDPQRREQAPAVTVTINLVVAGPGEYHYKHLFAMPTMGEQETSVGAQGKRPAHLAGAASTAGCSPGLAVRV